MGFHEYEWRYDVASIALNGHINLPQLRRAIQLLTPYKYEFRGLISELRAKLVVGALPSVEEVRKAADFEDIHHDIDFWVVFRSELFADVPVQIKSSKEGIEQVIRDKGKLNPEIIYLNCGPRATDEEILGEFFTQLAVIHNRSHTQELQNLDNND